MRDLAVADEGYAEPFTEDDRDAARREQEARDRLAAQVRAIAMEKEKEADRRVGLRTNIEQRWLRDLEQYHGIYDPETGQKLRRGKKSRAFINQTRAKTVTMAARLMDLLFPTDDKNWGIGPTPVPELSREAQAAARKAARANTEVAALEAETPPAAHDTDPALLAARKEAIDAMEAAKMLGADIAEARRRADLMAEEIDDQLKECNYQARMRDVIEDACKIGTGVVKGPIKGKARQAWGKVPPDPKSERKVEMYELTQVQSDAPSFARVDPWHFFPDPDVRTIEDSEANFQRHLLKRKGLQKLARQPGFDKDAIRRVLKSGSREAPPQFLSDLRSITGDSLDSVADYYTVWEYTGPLEQAEIQALALAMGDEAMMPEGEIDPLAEVNVVLWFCQGEVLYFGPYPLDSDECMYSVFCLEKDEASIFGYGIPYIARQPQSAINGGWRMLLDNAALSTGPIIVMDRRYVEPADGNWDLTPRKIYYRKADAPPNAKVFETYDIQSNQADLANIITLARQFLDEVTGMPMLAQGEQGQQTTQTMGGMSILMNAANVVFRRIVKNFDDDVTVPNIRRLYHFNMQFSDKAHIKGDMKVDARGSSVLLVREMQAQNLMNIALQFGGHPVYGALIKHGDLLREIFKAHMIAADKLVKSDDEIARDMQNAQQVDPEQDPRVIAARVTTEAQIQVANMEADTKRTVAEANRETTIMELALKANMSLDQIQAKLQESRERRESDERKFAAELAKTEQIGPSGGGNF